MRIKLVTSSTNPAADPSKRETDAEETFPEGGDGREPLRDKILEKASELLVEKGHSGFSLRELAAGAGTSTMQIYSLFGNRGGVLEALYESGFRRLYAFEKATEDTSNPKRWLWKKILAYRDFAFQNTAYYRLMFGGVVEFSPVENDTGYEGLAVPSRAAYPAFEYLARAVAACQQCDLLRSDFEASELAFMIWSHIHGIISLEYAGYSPADFDSVERYKTSVRLFLDGLTAPEFHKPIWINDQ